MVSIIPLRQGFVMHRIASVFRSNKERREKKSVTQELAAASAGIPQAIKNRVRCLFFRKCWRHAGGIAVRCVT